ncbi:MAG: site-specific integrase [Actinobacteria bacterium]|nr:site-specific integrase [Actinomycetota bacterium]
MTFPDDWRRVKGWWVVARRCDVVEGPLAPFAFGFWEQLGRLGYKEEQANKHVRVLADLSEWMGRRGICPIELSSEIVEDFFCERRQLGHAWLITGMAAKPLLGFLRAANVVPEPLRYVPCGPAEALLERYWEFLMHQRGLVAATVTHYGVAARMFVEAVGADQGRDLGSLTAAEVSRFVTEACSRPVKLSARELVSALRSFLRFAVPKLDARP